MQSTIDKHLRPLVKFGFATGAAVYSNLPPCGGDVLAQPGQRGVQRLLRSESSHLWHLCTPLCHFVTSPPQGGRLEETGSCVGIRPQGAIQ